MAFLEYTPKQTLFQFCSIDSFRSVLASKVIWCTDLESSNDPRELKLGIQHFIEAVNFVRRVEYSGPAGQFLDKIADELTSGSRRQQAFCACFTLLSDELPMWREYGDNCRGVAIGFRPTAIISMPGRIQRVRYLNADTAEDFRRLIRELVSHFDPKHSPNDVKYWVTATSSLLAAMTALKHHTWDYEKEIRFVFMQGRNADPKIPISYFADGKPIFWEKPLSRTRAAELIEYKAFQFGRRRQANDPSRSISQVVIGPRCELSTDEVIAELRKNGFEEFSVTSSECSVR